MQYLGAMKLTVYAAAVIIALSSCASKNTKVLTEVPKADTTCTRCVNVRIKNMGPDDISMVTLHNSNGEDFVFKGVKANSTSAYQKVDRLCSCGYEVDVLYMKTEDNQVLLNANCVNVQKCNEYLKGNAVIEINTPKLPDDLTKAKNVNMQLSINQE